MPRLALHGLRLTATGRRTLYFVALRLAHVAALPRLALHGLRLTATGLRTLTIVALRLAHVAACRAGRGLRPGFAAHTVAALGTFITAACACIIAACERDRFLTAFAGVRVLPTRVTGRMADLGTLPCRYRFLATLTGLRFATLAP